MRQSETGATPLFNGIYSEYITYIRNIAATFSRQHREDLVQEGLLGLFKACAAYDSSANGVFEAFAKTCIKNAMLSSYRHMSKDDKVVHFDDNSDSALHGGTDKLAQAEVREFFDSVRITFSEKEKTVFDAYCADMTYEQAARETGLTVKQVDNTLVSIRKKIKALYN